MKLNETDITTLLLSGTHNTDSFREEIIKEIYKGLAEEKKSISSRFFYDETGSDIFNAITKLPEYYLTRIEISLLKEFAGKSLIVRNPLELIELGSGDHSKISLLFDQIPAGSMHYVCYMPVDINESVLRISEKVLRIKYPGIQVRALPADFQSGIRLPDTDAQRLICFFGSTLGNLDRKQAKRFLRKISNLMKEGDHLLLGLDMVKNIFILEKAYNDTSGVTAAFNRNILNVVNHITGSDFDPLLFDHFAFFNMQESRIEMHLRANRDMRVTFPGHDDIFIRKGEMVHTENSCKYTFNDITHFADIAGFEIESIFNDSRNWYSLVYYRKSD
jgi:L-histidine Nalpha-methyltransferase